MVIGRDNNCDSTGIPLPYPDSGRRHRRSGVPRLWLQKDVRLKPELGELLHNGVAVRDACHDQRSNGMSEALDAPHRFLKT